ncbi:MAG: hypothetical protein HPY57_16145 [Ignavibacteria bacterium]|nr:hypothetical protein [Ignavibacteria bacterium]
MKKFTESINEKVNHYAGSQKLYNDIYNLIDETLNPKIDGNDSDNISLIGKEKLVEELAKIVENEVNKTKISILEEYKNDPLIFKKSKSFRDQIQEDYKKVAQTIRNIDKESQLNAAKKMIDNFDNKWDKIPYFEWVRLNVHDRVKELKNFLKDKEKELKEKK